MASRPNYVGIVRPNDGLGQGVVVRIANIRHGLLDAGFG